MTTVSEMLRWTTFRNPMRWAGGAALGAVFTSPEWWGWCVRVLGLVPASDPNACQLPPTRKAMARPATRCAACPAEMTTGEPKAAAAVLSRRRHYRMLHFTGPVCGRGSTEDA